MHSTKHHPWLSIFSLLLAATLWGIFWYPLRLLEDAGLSGLWSTLFIYLGTLPVLLNFLKGRLHELKRAPLLLITLALASGWCNIAFILALLDGNVVRVLLLFYLSPLWATIIGWWFLGERIHRSTILVLIFALGGAGVMLWEPGMGLPLPHDTTDWLALSSGLSFAIANALIRRTHTVSTYTKTAVSWLGVIGVAVILIVLSQTKLGDPSVLTVGSALGIGAILITLMTASVVYGVSQMPIHRSSIILLFEIVAGAVSSILLTSEIITLQEWIGGALVIFAALISARKQVA
ncbi:MAG: DMT family transporter [Gammaproteobacteria bacterium]|nr:DMT family transporter [Gammaproteobacteria bacterium]